jgi:hypothetical protein
MPSPKSGQAGTPVAPTAPAAAEEADKANPGEVEKAKAEQRQTQSGKYGAVKSPPFKPPKTDEEKQRKTSWIEIELVGEDDKPIGGQAYRVKLPDGSVLEGTLDPDGWARIEGFEKGDCDISFPGLDEEAWEFIESAGARPAGP